MIGKNKFFSILILFVFLLTGCSLGGSSNGGAEESYTIKWKNYDGTTLETDDVKKGVLPTYDGPTPIRPDDDEYTYTWSGWDPEVVPATANQTYVATYSYERTAYTINFDLNGGTSASYSGPKTVEAFTKDVFFFDCVKEGWNFRGWSYNGTKILDEKGNQLANPTMAKNMTFVAIYAQTAKMTIVTNLEGAGIITGEGEYPYNSYVDVSAYAKQGYKFIGWYFQDTLLSNTNEYKYMMWSEDVTLEVRFEIDSFLLNIHSNNENYGLVLLKSNINNEYLSEYQDYREYRSQVTIAAYSKTDVRFLGWYDQENKLIETNAVYNFVMPNHDYTLEAKWNYFTIDYVLNGGTNNLSNPTSYTIDSGRIILNEPTRTSYDFTGWSYNGKKVTEVDPVWIENITLVANWRAHTYSITYELNGGTNNSSNPSSYTIENSTINLKDATRYGYNFDGWYKDSSFTDKITTINNGSYGNLVIYAKWKPITYSVSYNLNGGVNSSNNPSSYTVEDNITFSAPTKTGYSFIGWFDDNGNQVTSISVGTTGALILTAHWNEGDLYTVTLDANGGSVSETLINVQYDHSYSLQSPTRPGYTFDGWYDDSTMISSNGTWKFTSNKTYVAHWTTIDYSITYNLNGGTNDLSNPSTYTVEDNITLSAPTKTGYSFIGWFDDNGNQVTSISVGTTGALILTAHWNEGDLYTVTLDANGGSVSETLINVQYDHSYSLQSPTRPGYTFDGWYDDSTMISSNGTWKFTSNKTYVAHWTTIDYSITYNLNGGTNDLSNPSTYTVEDNITLSSPTKKGYTFLGWYSNDTMITTISLGSTGELNLEARWSANLNPLSIESEDTSKGTVAITSGSGYSGESITVVATPADDCLFGGWYHESTKVSNDATYTFIMPTNDYSLVAHFLTKPEEKEMRRLGIIPTLSEDGKTITYGLYPQTNVNDSSLLSSLNSLTTPEENGWYLYDGNYYAKVSAKPYESSYTFDNGTTIESGTTYWFKCEPIVRNILSNTSGEYYIVLSVLLDVHCYYNSRSSRTIDGHIVYENNYKYSDIRTWLNEDFYNSAFTLGNEYIQTTTVDNSASTTSKFEIINNYACDNTEDKVFLLSCQDYQNSSYGFSTTSRSCKTTDWARARGAEYCTHSPYLYNGYYWTRSPHSNDSECVWYVYEDGWFSYCRIDCTAISVRPGLSIKIA